jgi:iron complex transport system ATP-binding protein
MIELLGVGVMDPAGGWQLRRVTATLEAGTLVAVLSTPPVHAEALLAAISGQRVPDEGRIWIDGLPLIRQTASRVRRRIADIDAAQPLQRSASVVDTVSWMSRRRRWLSLLTEPAGAHRDAVLRSLATVGLIDRSRVRVGEISDVDRVLLRCAGALTRPMTAVVIRNVDQCVCADAMAHVLQRLRMLARQRRITIVAGATDAVTAAGVSDRVVWLSQGRLLDRGAIAAGRCPEPA